ncbi:hypothetical protein AURDEDRAFT_161507 [Auricularia subglabra TFB-10046 SS5]|nr:hypothetical protein AURDEDRAFT_161507 [Auricularia subglabra TFB-10046 SS5]
MFAHFPRLKQLNLAGAIIPGDPALLRADTWDALPILGLFGRKAAERWLNLGVAIAKVFCIFLSTCGASGVDSLAELLGCRLTVEFPFTDRARIKSTGFFARFSVYGDANPRQRIFRMPFTLSIHSPRNHAIMAFQNAFVSDRTRAGTLG